MNTKKITGWVILGGIAVWMGWDTVVITNDIAGDTISELVLDYSHRYPVIPFAFGFVCGHLFWAQIKKQKENT